MPLVFMQVEQLQGSRWHIEFEGAGISANRIRGDVTSFEDAMLWIVREHDGRAPVDLEKLIAGLMEYAGNRAAPPPPKAPDTPRPIDESLLPPPPKPPVGRRNAAQRRLEADAELKRRGATRIVHRERTEDE